MVVTENHKICLKGISMALWVKRIVITWILRMLTTEHSYLGVGNDSTVVLILQILDDLLCFLNRLLN